MYIKQKAMGPYQTNCYIISIKEKDLIIDPGFGATNWVIENTNNPIAILNTHGHFDHIWSNQELKNKLNIPIYINKNDAFLLKEDIFDLGTPISSPDFEINGDKSFNLENIKISFTHFPGHTPGCSTIEINNFMFSGDFIFKNSIGRTDLPYSNPNDMKKSLIKFKNKNYDKTIYPGHGSKTSIKDEQKNVDFWLKQI